MAKTAAEMDQLREDFKDEVVRSMEQFKINYEKEQEAKRQQEHEMREKQMREYREKQEAEARYKKAREELELELLTSQYLNTFLLTEYVAPQTKEVLKSEYQQ